MARMPNMTVYNRSVDLTDKERSEAGLPVELPAMTVNTLNALGYVYQRDGRATVRTVKEVVDRITGRSNALSQVQRHLRRLIAVGLADGGGEGGRLRPLVERGLVENVDF